MRELNNKEMIDVQMEMLKDIDSFCKKNSIDYSLDGGTLIGAIRHHGMIPWDDDIDIMMVREQYDKFVSSYHSSKFILKSYDYRLESWLLATRVVDPSTVILFNNNPSESPHGIWVTVFPVDNAPDSSFLLKLKVWRIRVCKRLFEARNFFWRPYASTIKNLAALFVHCLVFYFPKDFWQIRAEKAIRWYNDRRTKRKGFFAMWQEKPWTCSAQAYEKYLDWDFDGLLVKVLQGYDEYLTSQYGDYMTLPPIEERVPKHDYKAYWRD
jgi:lipopolysaccharide cholinephosphotransferase